MSRVAEEPTIESVLCGPEQSPGPQFDFSPWESLSLPQAEVAVSTPAVKGKDSFGIIGRAASLALLLVASPLFLLIAIAIKIESPRGPVFYKQERVGLDRRRNGQAADRNGNSDGWNAPERRKRDSAGRTFNILKFRTMIPDAEAATGPVWASERDPRITRVGRVLRHLRLDELPQLVNVLLGQMRLIGPRPERDFFIQQLSVEMPDYHRRLSVPPGITGLAQVEREYDSDMDDVRRKLGYDLFYVDNRCPILDFKILVKTVDVILRGRGAR
jgi:lipopolysaccharide/colanic/teichoic acid biosynthesis glycosyltransferase